MATRLPASQHTREELTALIEGRLSTASAKDELVKLATRLIIEEGLEGEASDAIGRDYYEHGARGAGRDQSTRRDSCAWGCAGSSSARSVPRPTSRHCADRTQEAASGICTGR